VQVVRLPVAPPLPDIAWRDRHKHASAVSAGGLAEGGRSLKAVENGNAMQLIPRLKA
jgi:hypothetical protein